MLKKHSFWFYIAIILQCITGFFHTLSLLNSPKPNNETEKQLFDLMSNYKFNFGAGFHHSMEDIMNSFSISFTLFLLFSTIINFYLLKSKLPSKILKGVILINFFTYLIVWIVMCFLTFLPPIICTGLIALSLFVSYITCKREA